MPLDYDIGTDLWPTQERGKPLAPVRVGVDARTGKVLMGRRHANQSLGKIFATRYHERILRQWVGSFVPHLLGRNTSESTITRFFWAFATAIDLWEPNYTVQSVYVQWADLAGDADREAVMSSPEEIRQGHIEFQINSVYRPRGHLGDMAAEERRGIGLIGRNERWDIR